MNPEERIKELEEENSRLRKMMDKKKKEEKHEVVNRPAILHYKLIVMGSGGVGKSALTIRFMIGSFTQNYNPTIEDTYNKDIEVDNHLYHLEVLDTAGQSDQFYNSYFRKGNIFLFLFSINNRESLDHIKDLYETLHRIRDNENLPIVLVGTKCDLGEERVVSSEDARKFAAEIGASYIETSAKTGFNISEAFKLGIKLGDEKIPLPIRPKPSSWGFCVLV